MVVDEPRGSAVQGAVGRAPHLDARAGGGIGKVAGRERCPPTVLRLRRQPLRVRHSRAWHDIQDVLHLVSDLRAAGANAGLLDQVHRRLADASWLDRADMAESLEQMRRGEGHVIVDGPQR